MSLPALLLLLSLARFQGAPAQPASSEASLRQLFAALSGSWSCQGQFADKRSLAADLKFAVENGGRSVSYWHRDRAPNSYVQHALWGADASNDAAVSVGFAGNSTVLAPQLFVAKEWSASKIIFEAQKLTSPPFRPNRFTYALADAKTLSVVWEVERDGQWSVGDSLQCSASGE